MCLPQGTRECWNGQKLDLHLFWRRDKITLLKIGGLCLKLVAWIFQLRLFESRLHLGLCWYVIPWSLEHVFPVGAISRIRLSFCINSVWFCITSDLGVLPQPTPSARGPWCVTLCMAWAWGLPRGQVWHRPYW